MDNLATCIETIETLGDSLNTAANSDGIVSDMVEMDEEDFSGLPIGLNFYTSK